MHRSSARECNRAPIQTVRKKPQAWRSSEKKDQEYFSDGLSEELIDRLSHSQDLRVISRTSSFYFKGKRATIGEIANTLHVSHVLEGSVRGSGIGGNRKRNRRT